MITNHAVAQIFNLLYAYSYLILFPLVVIEGPIVTIIAGFLASLGFLNPFIAYAVVVTGDLGGDILYYFAGRWWLKSAFNKIISFFHIGTKRVEKTEEALRKHKGEVLFFGKLSHVVGIFILFIAGHAEIPFGDYVWFNFLATLPKSLILLAVGYYFGSSITSFRRSLDFTVLGLFIFTLILIGLYYAITYLAGRFITKLEK
jgi:membrane protein DedA with SNARE-associated domain